MATYFDVNAALGVREYPPEPLKPFDPIRELSRLKRYAITLIDGPWRVVSAVAFDDVAAIVQLAAGECEKWRSAQRATRDTADLFEKKVKQLNRLRDLLAGRQIKWIPQYREVEISANGPDRHHELASLLKDIRDNKDSES